MKYIAYNTSLDIEILIDGKKKKLQTEQETKQKEYERNKERLLSRIT